MSWLLEITDGGTDLYPEIKRRTKKAMDRIRRMGGARAVEHKARESGNPDWWRSHEVRIARDMVRLRMMLEFGYYITESSEHNAEYMPYWIKSRNPELLEEYNIPLDEYPRRCVNQIKHWKQRSKDLTSNPELAHSRSHEYGSYIMEAMETDIPFRIGGNVLNNGLIPNLPAEACVEVPCMVDRNGVQGCYVGPLPPQCAALNRTNINVQLLTLEAARSLRKEHVYHAAMLDPHTSAELTIDEIKAMCDDLIAAHGDMLPRYR